MGAASRSSSAPAAAALPCGSSEGRELKPGEARILLHQPRFELWIAVGLESRPVERGFQTLSVGRAQPKFHRQLPLADVRMLAQRETFVKFNLRLGRVRFAIVVPGQVG